jgi:hypothetical protein
MPLALYSGRMKLHDRVLESLAEMVVGDHPLFPYRSSSYITDYFHRCGLQLAHDGTTRKWWARERLMELNLGPASVPDLPSDDVLSVIAELFDPLDFENKNLTINPALDALNTILKRHSLFAYLDATGRCYLRNTGSGTTSPARQPQRPLSADEIEQRRTLAAFLDSASEDELTERMLVPFFQRLGFQRVSPAGHREKSNEFGKDLWMKLQLPTGHWLYFCAQIKREKLDSNAASVDKNVAAVLSQARMAIDHPIFDSDTNRKVLLDHIFLISAGEITKQARTWLIEKLDAGQRRHIIFMDRNEFLDHSARILVDLRLENEKVTVVSDDDIPF